MIMMTRHSCRPVSKSTLGGIAIIIIRSAPRDMLATVLRPDLLSPEKPRIVNPALFSRLFIAAALLCVSAPAYSQSQDTDIRGNADQLTAEEIKSVFSNVTMDGAYNFGRNGKAQSFYTEKHNADGTLSYKEDGTVEPGRWFVRKDSICYMYPSNQMAGGCFRVYQVKNCYYFYDAARRQVPYETGEAYWTARSVKMGERAGCEKAIS